MREHDQDKVPDDFPPMKCVYRIHSQGGKPYRPFYKAQDVWRYFARAHKVNETGETP